MVHSLIMKIKNTVRNVYEPDELRSSNEIITHNRASNDKCLSSNRYAPFMESHTQ